MLPENNPFKEIETHKEVPQEIKETVLNNISIEEEEVTSKTSILKKMRKLFSFLLKK